MLIVALIINFIILLGEIFVLAHINKKRNIFKYYTFLQNFIAAISSGIFIIYLILNIFFEYQIDEYVKGIRYVTTCGLLTASIVYIFLMSANEKNMLTDEDFTKLNPRLANTFLHFLFPILSLVSFVCFERDVILLKSIWTILVIVPSALYWLIYLLLSIFKVWEAPYDLKPKSKGTKGLILEILMYILIPIIFILISFILWNIK